MIIGTDNLAYEAQNATTSHPNGYADGVTQGDTGTADSFGRVLQDMIPFNHDSSGSYNFNLYKDILHS